MFCPRCSTQNSDDTKFCRGCGTNLANVSLVLSDPQQLASAVREKVASISLAKRRAAISNLIHGTGWIGASTIVGVALGLFSNTNDWIFVWLGLAAWMACVGIIQWSQGVNKLVEARSLQRELDLTAAEAARPGIHELGKGDSPALSQVPTTNRLDRSSSVTEHTTDLLNHEHSH